jgi:hypothetical protein
VSASIRTTHLGAWRSAESRPTAASISSMDDKGPSSSGAVRSATAARLWERSEAGFRFRPTTETRTSTSTASSKRRRVPSTKKIYSFSLNPCLRTTTPIWTLGYKERKCFRRFFEKKKT